MSVMRIWLLDPEEEPADGGDPMPGASPKPETDDGGDPMPGGGT